MKNVTISYKPRPVPTEIPDTDSKYKQLRFKRTNFVEIITKETQGMSEDEQDSIFMELGLYELQRCFSIFRYSIKNHRHQDNYFDFKSVDNKQIIKELSIFAEKFPSFILIDGEIEYPSLDDVDEAYRPYVEVQIANGEVRVLLN